MSLNNTRVNGQAFTNEIYIHIQWKWVTLPLILSAVSLVFLILTIRLNKHQSGILRKSSALAPLLYDIKGQPGHKDPRYLRDLSQVNDIAKKMMVSIEEEDERFVFVEH